MKINKLREEVEDYFASIGYLIEYTKQGINGHSKIFARGLVYGVGGLFFPLAFTGKLAQISLGEIFK